MALPGSGPPYGTGTPTTAPLATGNILADSTGTTTGSRFIDPTTRDYVIDSNGRTTGMSNVQQLVYLAVSTDLGSSAVQALGQQLKQIDRITANFERQVTTTLTASVQHIVDQGLMQVVDVIVERVGPSVARARLRWRDLSVDASTTNIQETVI